MQESGRGSTAEVEVAHNRNLDAQRGVLCYAYSSTSLPEGGDHAMMEFRQHALKQASGLTKRRYQDSPKSDRWMAEEPRTEAGECEDWAWRPRWRVSLPAADWRWLGEGRGQAEAQSYMSYRQGGRLRRQ